MTTSVYKPIDFGGGLSRPGIDKKMFRPGIQRVKRALFAVDHEETQRFLQEEFKKIAVKESERWNFDFVRERTLHPDGTFVWQPMAKTGVVAAKKRPIECTGDLEELYARPEDIVRPKCVKLEVPAKEEDNNNVTTSCSKTGKTQSGSRQKSIKDFMFVVKRQVSADSKKTSSSSPIDFHAVPPSKKLKIADS